MNFIAKALALSLLSSLSVNAMDCSSVKDIKEFNGHYYTVTSDKLTFNIAKQIAQNNDGYLAVPDTEQENEYIKNLIAGDIAWIGILDPNYTSSYCYEGEACSDNLFRFKTISGNIPSYTNWDVNQPDNLVRGYDIVDNVAVVSPLGEHWVAISGMSGLWADYGTHADSFNNPTMFKAVFEFDKKPDCYKEDDALSADDFNQKKCHTKVWDEDIDVVNQGRTFDCLIDKHGNDYCPEGLANAGEYWDYDDGYSVAATGSYQYDCSGYESSTGYQGTTNETVFISQAWSGCCTDGNQGSCQKAVNSWNPGRTCIFQYQMSGTCTANDGKVYPRGYQFDCGIYDVRECPEGWTPTTERGTRECKRTISVWVQRTCTAYYTYYNYLCHNQPNIHNQNWQISNSGGTSSRDVTPPSNNCRRKGFTCNSNIRKPVWVDNKWQCSPFPCVGEDNIERLDTMVGSSDSDNKGWSEDGNCEGQLYLFSGKSEQCRSWDMFFGLTGGGCCNKEDVFLGLISCKSNEKLLAEKNKAEQCHYVGEFCSKKINLGFSKICVQKSKGHCCFNSKLARIINVQGRIQLNRGWGSGDNPDCKGFTPEEFQKLDLSKVDFSEFIKDIKLLDMESFAESIKNRVQDNIDVSFPKK